ncbi:hypothetical protein CHARACLAT_029483 [Characodon lateralis]|uniref:Uncharacterized protein n=1 Tax=Characodon lateralis TaxID=208331 RepID=A0ABU7EH30_9TELE|nr:hypothetical protein [Characodon lateralis]
MMLLKHETFNLSLIFLCETQFLCSAFKKILLQSFNNHFQNLKHHSNKHDLATDQIKPFLIQNLGSGFRKVVDLNTASASEHTATKGPKDWCCKSSQVVF